MDGYVLWKNGMVDWNHCEEDWSLYGIGTEDWNLIPLWAAAIIAWVLDYVDMPLHSMCLGFYMKHMFSVENMFVLWAKDIMCSIWHLHHLPGEHVQQDGGEKTVEEIEPLEPLPRSLQWPYRRTCRWNGNLSSRWT